MSIVGKLWKWSPLVTLPVVVLFVFWAQGTVVRWFHFQVEMHTSTDLSLLKVGELEADHMLRLAEVSTTGSARDALLEESGLRTIHLYIKSYDQNRLDSDIPHSSRHYVDGGMYYDGEIRDVKVRYRGDNVYHWGYWKKSWRVKTDKGRLFDGMRKFNLVAPRTVEIVNNYLSMRIAEAMGMIAPRVELVNVSVNGKLQGIFILTEQLEESTIRRADRMPGDVYSGELVGLDSHGGLPNHIWDSTGFWSKVAVNNHFDESSMAPLEALLYAVNAAVDHPGDQAPLHEIIDLEAFARFAVFESVVGTLHIDNLHNWRLYYDPWDTSFVPIAWDPVGWNKPERPRPGVPFRADVLASDLMGSLHQSAPFLHEKARMFQEFFAKGLDRVLLSEMDAAIDGIRPLLQLDPNMVYLAELQSPEVVLQALLSLRSYLVEHLAALRSAHLGNAQGLMYWDLEGGRIGLKLSGIRSLDAVRIEFLEPFEGHVGATVSWREGSDLRTVDVSDRVFVSSARVLRLEVALVADIRVQMKGVKPLLGAMAKLNISPGSYEVEFQGLPKTAEILSVTAKSGSLDLVGTRSLSAMELIPMGPMYNRIVPARDSMPIVWQGDITIEGIQTIEEDLVIRPDTRILMQPGASLLLKGLVKADGLADQRIKFVQAAGNDVASEAWGTVAIIGDGARGSSFKYCNFKGGSGLKRDLSEFTAMFSIHGVSGARIVGCVFEDNYFVDDMVHAVYSEVTFKSCAWIGSLADALDVDISTTVVEDCWFDSSGNDAIDLMTTKATVVGCTIERSGDKGVSVGEGSEFLSIDNRIRNCFIGVEPKDDSVALIINTDISGCGTGVNAYRKNWRYSTGGSVYLYLAVIEGEGIPLQADSNSFISVEDSYVPNIASVERTRGVRLHHLNSGLGRRALGTTPEVTVGARHKALLSEAMKLWASRLKPGVRGHAE